MSHTHGMHCTVRRVCLCLQTADISIRNATKWKIVELRFWFRQKKEIVLRSSAPRAALVSRRVLSFQYQKLLHYKGSTAAMT